MTLPDRHRDPSAPHEAAELSGLTLDVAGAEHVTEICRRFEAAWRQVLVGGPMPRPDEYLGLASGAEREALRAEISHIQRSFEKLIPNRPADSRAVTGEFGGEDAPALVVRATARMLADGEV